MGSQLLADRQIEERLGNEPQEAALPILGENQSVHFDNCVHDARRIADRRGIAILVQQTGAQGLVHKRLLVIPIAVPEVEAKSFLEAVEFDLLNHRNPVTDWQEVFIILPKARFVTSKLCSRPDLILLPIALDVIPKGFRWVVEVKVIGNITITLQELKQRLIGVRARSGIAQGKAGFGRNQEGGRCGIGINESFLQIAHDRINQRIFDYYIAMFRLDSRVVNRLDFRQHLRI